jgi:flavin reductase (DIM6/NTAB) family NADH-FMN oxidoreductase RutF
MTTTTRSPAVTAELLTETDLDSDVGAPQLRRVFGAFPSGVTAIAALIDGEPVGIAASSFTSVSLDPALVSVCVAHTSTTWPTLSRATHFGLSVLGSDQNEVCRQLAARTGDRFAGIGWRATAEGAVLLDEASAWLACTIHQVVRAGDHDIVLLQVESHRLHPDPERAPLVFHASQFKLLGRCL